MTNAVGRIERRLVLVAVWAGSTSLASLLPLTAVAIGAFAITLAALTHAVTVAATVGIADRLFGIRRWPPAGRATVAVAATATAAYLFGGWSAQAGDSRGGVLVAVGVYLLGVAVYVRRRQLARELARRVRSTPPRWWPVCRSTAASIRSLR